MGRGRVGLLALIVLAALLVGTIAPGTVATLRGDQALPRWDEAKYGLDAAGIADALRRDEPLRLAGIVRDLSVWPPVVPVVAGTTMLSAGPGVEGPRALSAICLVLLPGALVWAGAEIAGRVGAWAGLLAAAGTVPGEVPRLMGTLGMLEAPGALAVVAALALQARAWRLGGRRRRLRAWAAGSVVFLVKANYGVLWLAPAVLHELRETTGSWRATAVAAGRGVRALKRSRPLPWLVLAAFGSSAAIAILGGVETEVFGIRIRSRSAGNPWVVLWALVLISWASRPRRSLALFRRWRRSLPERRRAAVDATLVPLAIWYTIPPHLKDLVSFLDNRSSGVPLLSWRTFTYPWESLQTQYAAPGFPSAVVAAIGLLGGALWISAGTPRRRLLGLVSVIGLLAVQVHPYQQPRFLFTVVFPLSIAGGLVIQEAMRRIGSREVASVVTGLAVGALLAVGVAAESSTRARVDAARATWTVPSADRAVLGVLLEAGRRRPSLVVGLWDGLSPPLLDWAAVAGDWTLADRSLRPVAWGRSAGERDDGALRRVLERRPELVQVVMVDRVDRLDPTGPWDASRRYREETAWLASWRSGPMTGWTRVSDERVIGTSYRLTTWRRTGR